MCSVDQTSRLALWDPRRLNPTLLVIRGLYSGLITTEHGYTVHVEL